MWRSWAGQSRSVLLAACVRGGWPMGAPWVTKEHSERYLRIDKQPVNVKPGRTHTFSDQEGMDPIVCVSYMPRAEVSDADVFPTDGESGTGSTS
jgi:hypothetical protein